MKVGQGKSGPPQNAPATINNINYSRHAVGRMQGRGITPTVVEHTIEYGRALPTKDPTMTQHWDPVNNVSVFFNSGTQAVVTTRRGNRIIIMSDLDKLRYKLMLKSLDEYSHSVDALGKLSYDLETLVEALDEVDQKWKDDFMHERDTIEIFYANALHMGIESLDPEQNKIIEETMQNIRHMVESSLAR